MNEKSAKVTVILPVYNGEKYLSRAIMSVLEQSIGQEEIKLYIINDGSIDESDVIIKKFCQLYPKQIIYVSQENQGVSFSRNLGITNCQTKWLTFIDQDDFFEKDFLDTLIKQAEKNDADVLISGYQRVGIDNEILYQTRLGKGEAAKFSNVALWAKLHKTQFLQENKITVFDNKVGEDIAFSFNELFQSDKVYCIAYIGYNWFDNSVSVSNTIQKNIVDIMPAILNLFAYCINLKQEFTKLEEYFIVLRMIGYLHLTMKSSRRKEFMTAWQELEKNISARFPKWYNNQIIYFKAKGLTPRLFLSMLAFVMIYRLKLLKYSVKNN